MVLLSLSFLFCHGIAQSLWPQDTQIQASSVYPPSPNLKTHYDASLAIDGDNSTFWCDNTENDYSEDYIALRFSSSIKLAGLHLLSSSVGWVTEYHVETLSLDGSLTSIANASNVPSADSTVHFPSAVECLGIKLTVSNSSFTYFGDLYARINEVSPLYADGSGPASTTSQPPSPPGPKPQQSANSSPVPNNQPEPAPERKDFTGIIIGVIGGTIIMVLLIVLTAARIKRRYRRGVPQIWERKDPRASFISAPQLIQDPSGTQNAESGLGGAWIRDRLTDKGFKLETAEIRLPGPELHGSRTPMAELPDMTFERHCDESLQNHTYRVTMDSVDSTVDKQSNC